MMHGLQNVCVCRKRFMCRKVLYEYMCEWMNVECSVEKHFEWSKKTRKALNKCILFTIIFDRGVTSFPGRVMLGTGTALCVSSN